MEKTAEQLLAQLKDELAFEEQTKDGAEVELPAKVLADHAVNTRKTHKWLYSQLQVMQFLLDFLDSDLSTQDASRSAVRLLDWLNEYQPCILKHFSSEELPVNIMLCTPCLSDGLGNLASDHSWLSLGISFAGEEVAEAKQQWKALKTEYLQQVETIEGAVPQALDKLEEARDKAQLLEEALQCYHTKKLEMELKVRSAQARHQKEQELLFERQQEVEGLVAELQDRLQVQHKELQHLQQELREQDRQACRWQEKFQEISGFQHLLEMLQGVKLTNASESNLEFELIPHSQPLIPKPHSLKLCLHWGDDGNVTLQSYNPLFLVSAVLPMGTCSTIKDIILELHHSYSQQAQLLAEIELLQS
ncbi:hypothetical protein lerEdw1_005524 [Lerista edwardsae]|nr:hypothetical protein lerEdw1_005524 [Lerista edwardsae]